MLEISTVHVHVDDGRLLGEGIWPGAIYDMETSSLVYVPTSDDEDTDDFVKELETLGYSEALTAVVRLAALLGIFWVRLDGEGPISPMLPSLIDTWQ